MAFNNKYPRVVVGTKVMTRDLGNRIDEGRTTLFMPIVSERGTVGELVKVHSLAELSALFGDLDYAVMGQGALNLYQWLVNGGYAYVTRIVRGGKATVDSGTAQVKITVNAKYPGKYYNDIKVKLTGHGSEGNLRYTVDITKNSKLLERFNNLRADQVRERVNKISQLVELKYDGNPITADGIVNNSGENVLRTLLLTLAGAVDISTNEYISAYEDIFTYGASVNADNNIYNELLQDETHPIDVILLDNIFPDKEIDGLEELKTAVFAFILNHRRDISIISDGLDIEDGGTTIEDEDDGEEIQVTPFKPGKRIDENNHYSIAVIHPNQTTVNYNPLNDSDTVVGATYHYATLIPRHDKEFGIQYPIAGMRRAELAGVKKLNGNLTPTGKNEAIMNRYNYIDQDSRGYRLFSNLNFMAIDEDTEYNSLAFFNNSRVLNRIIRDIKRIGKKYIFEFNDTTTLTNMRNEMNKYIAGWVQNRSLSLADIEVESDAFLDDVVNVSLSVQFTGIIEVINVSIVVD